MATDIKQLTKKWIEFLKHNQIADSQSDPKTGDLRYKKPVLPKHLDIFLRTNTDFEDADIKNAIQMVLARKMAGNKQRALPPGLPKERQPNQAKSAPQSPQPRQPATPSSHPEVVGNPQQNPRQQQPKYSKNDAEDIDYKEKQRQARLKEAIKDDVAAETLDEKDVEDVFNMLIHKESTTPSAEEESNAEKFNKIKSIIRDSMSASHRKALWRALTNE